MEKTIKILTAVGVILGGLGELLKQFNISKIRVKEEVQRILDEPEKELKEEAKSNATDTTAEVK